MLSEDYEALRMKITQYGNKLLKKSDQCRLLCMCAHLYWSPPPPPPTTSMKTINNDTLINEIQNLNIINNNPSNHNTTPSLHELCENTDKVIECLQKSLKIANSVNSNDCNMYIDILDR